MSSSKAKEIPTDSQVADPAIKRQLRVAAYCRVHRRGQSTNYEVQRKYYTDKITANPDWTMVGIFADEGIPAASTRKRPEFDQMIEQCKENKIDLILTKSIFRFARNVMDCVTYVRLLREFGVVIIFEEENISTLESDMELLITLQEAVAQLESKRIASTIRRRNHQAMQEGKINIHCKFLYAYEKGDDGKLQIIPEQAAVVKGIYDRYLAGANLRQIKEWLKSEGILTATRKTEWTTTAIRSILTNEKYCGDVLLQKTFVSDSMSRKVIKNTGQLPMYLVKNHHEGIVDRETYDAVQAEMARRKTAKASKQL